MKYVPSILAASMALALTSCGGSNNGNNNNSGSGGSTANGNVQIIAQLVANNTNGPYLPNQQNGVGSGCPMTFKYIDPNNIEVGDSWQFQLASISSTGSVTLLPATGWTTTDTNSTYGSVSSDKGVLTTNSQTRVPETVGVTFNGTAYRAQYSILPFQARVRGQVVAHDTGAPIAGVEVDFYGPNSLTDASLVFRGKAITQLDGTFQASVLAELQVPDGSGGTTTFVPTQFFQINNSSLPTTFQQYFEYNSNVYQSGLLTCVAPIQVPGTATPMPLATGNNDLISITQCPPSPSNIMPTNGWIMVYSTKEAAPTPTGCSS